MILIEAKETGLVSIVETTDGYDMSQWTVIDDNVEDPNPAGNVWTGNAFAEAEGLYAVRRRAEYPPVEDQLDALWKGGDAAEEMRARIATIKQKYPKS